MAQMFNGAGSFNQNINTWDVGNVTGFYGMFESTPFNQPLNSWTITSATDLGNMFQGSAFNQDISSWDTSTAVAMIRMFRSTSFNQDISSWDVSNVTTMNQMFESNTAFNADLSGWCVTNIPTAPTNFGAVNAVHPVWGTCPQLGSEPSGTFNVLITTAAPLSFANSTRDAIQSQVSKYSGLTVNFTISAGSATMPTVTVGQYDAILFYPDGPLNWNASMTAHHNANGGLVTAGLYNSTGVTGIPATLMPTVNSYGGQTAGVELDSSVLPYGHPIGDGYNSTTQQVTSFRAVGLANNGSLSGVIDTNGRNAGAVAVLPGTFGEDLSIAWVKDNSEPAGRTVFINYFPVSSTGFAPSWNATTYPDGGLILLNALLWSARRL
jgi:surface protein